MYTLGGLQMCLVGYGMWEVGTSTGTNSFLLMDNSNFLLMDGTDFLLMTS